MLLLFLKILNLRNFDLIYQDSQVVEWHKDDIHVHSLYHAKHLIVLSSEETASLFKHVLFWLSSLQKINIS